MDVDSKTKFVDALRTELCKDFVGVTVNVGERGSFNGVVSDFKGEGPSWNEIQFFFNDDEINFEYLDECPEIPTVIDEKICNLIEKAVDTVAKEYQEILDI